MATKDVKIRISQKGAKKTAGGLKKVDNSLMSMGKAAGVATAAYFGSKKLIEALKKTIELSGKMDGLERGFKNLTRSAGFSVQTFEKLQKATDGTMSSMDLLKQANNAMLLGIFESEDQMAQMFDTAQRLAQALGQDAAFGIESLVTGMGRQSKLMLDNLGIMVKTEDAYKQYADQLGTTVEGLTDQQKKQAFVNASMKEAQSLVKGLGEEQLTATDSMSKMDASTERLWATIGKKLAPGMKILADDTARVADNFTRMLGGLDEGGPSLEEQTDKLLKRAEALKIVTSDSKEAIVINDDFFNTFSQGGKQEDLALTEEHRKQQLKSIEDQIAANLLLMANKHELTNVIEGIKEAEFEYFEGVEVAENKQFIRAEKRRMLKQKQIVDELKQAALVQGSAKDAMKAVVRAESMEAVAGLISSILKSVPFPFNTILAAGAGATAASLIDKGLSQFATGGDFVTSGPQMIMVGDNPGGKERVQVTPLGSPNVNGPQGGININFSGPITNDDYVRDFIIPEITKATRLNLA